MMALSFLLLVVGALMLLVGTALGAMAQFAGGSHPLGAAAESVASVRRAASLLIALGIACLALFIFIPSSARAHDAPTGWRYPWACCSNQDCRMVPYEAIREGGHGYVIEATGEVVPYADKRVRDSPDGEFHWCSEAGGDHSRTICLFVPPRSY